MYIHLEMKSQHRIALQVLSRKIPLAVSHVIVGDGSSSFTSHLLQCVAACCNVLQYVAACFSVLQRVAVCCGMFQRVITHFVSNLHMTPSLHTCDATHTGWRTPIGYLIFIGHFFQKSPAIRGPFAEKTCNLRRPVRLCHPVYT